MPVNLVFINILVPLENELKSSVKPDLGTFDRYFQNFATTIINSNSIVPGADPGFFLGGGALVSCSTSTPINHIVFFGGEYQLY